MNKIVEKFKKGSRIHIKKENKGKFTDYCGGKVTSECIAKGKNSSNPAVRKRATFADNARHFKHRSGGVVKAEEGTKINGDTGKWFVNLGTNLYDGISSSIKLNEINEELLKYKNAKLKSLKPDDFSDYVRNWMDYSKSPDENISDIAINFHNNKLQQEQLKTLRQQTSLELDNLILQQRLASNNNQQGIFGLVLSTGLGALGNYLGIKNLATSQV